jgi:hypothetical protein
VLLGVKTDNERGNVHDLLADADVTLTDEDTGVVDGLGKTELVDASLQATLQEVLDLQGKDVIELHAALVEDTDTDQTANERIALEETLGVLLVKSEELTMWMLDGEHHNIVDGRNIPGSTTDLGEGELDAPDLTLVAETVLANSLQLSVAGCTLDI